MLCGATCFLSYTEILIKNNVDWPQQICVVYMDLIWYSSKLTLDAKEKQMPVFMLWIASEKTDSKYERKRKKENLEAVC